MNGSSHRPVEISVFDKVLVNADLSATIIRRYTFVNPNDEPEIIELARTERFDTPIEGFECTSSTIPLQVLPPLAGPIYQVPWSSTRSHSLPPDGEIVVEFRFRRVFLNVSPPLEGRYEYASTERILYSIEITPPWPSLFRLSQFTISPAPVDSEMSQSQIGEDGTLIISQRRISVNKGGRFSLSIQCNPSDVETLELLQIMVKDAKDAGVSLTGVSAILVLHLLTDSLSFIDGLKAIGLDLSRTFIVGIPYSLKEHVIVRLLARGYKNIFAPTNYPFLTEIDAVIRAAASSGDADSKDLLIIEDGGYIVPRLHNEFPELIPRVIGAVEQTANGIWAYEDIPKRRRSIATMNVAECDLKKRKESPLIGDAVFRNITRLLEGARLGVRDKQVLVIGYGATGSNVAKVFKNNGARVTVFDEKRKRRTQARTEGFEIASTIDEAIKGKFLVIGCTGKVSVKISSLLRADHDTYFVNASSKRLEVDHHDLTNITSSTSPIPNVGVKYHLVNNKDLTILANGFPVNFHGIAESVPDKELQFIYGLLFGSAIHVVQESDLKPGIVYVPEEMQKRIEELHDALLSI